MSGRPTSGRWAYVGLILTTVAHPTTTVLLLPSLTPNTACCRQVTCFEILTGRTPFERSELEAFTTPAELEIYHARTAAGTWLGEWSLSRPMEDLLRGMTDPVDERRLTAEQAVEHRALRKSTDEAGRCAFPSAASRQHDCQEVRHSKLTHFLPIPSRRLPPRTAAHHSSSDAR